MYLYLIRLLRAALRFERGGQIGLDRDRHLISGSSAGHLLPHVAIWFGCTSNCCANSACVSSPFTAANASFTLKAGLWGRVCPSLLLSRSHPGYRQAENPLISLSSLLRAPSSRCTPIETKKFGSHTSEIVHSMIALGSRPEMLVKKNKHVPNVECSTLPITAQPLRQPGANGPRRPPTPPEPSVCRWLDRSDGSGIPVP
jgi:hypothetical protein